VCCSWKKKNGRVFLLMRLFSVSIKLFPIESYRYFKSWKMSQASRRHCQENLFLVNSHGKTNFFF
jgi:hypothetical protein